MRSARKTLKSMERWVWAAALFALSAPVRAQNDYVPLTNIPGVTDTRNPVAFFNGLFRLFVVIAAFLAVIRIIYGGFKYLTTDAVNQKGDARAIIQDAVLGLALILISVLLLQVINPDILNLRIFATR